MPGAHVNVDIDADDGAKKPLTSGEADVSQVKFIPASSQDKNGELVIVNEAKARKSGLTKEELMKYANDPFWVRLRLTLFILFWVLWFSMFIGAVIIIIMVPKCPASSRLKWYQRSTMYQANLKEMESGNKSLAVLTEKLDYLNSIGVETLILAGVQGESLIDVDPKVGTLKDLEALTEKVEKNMGPTKNVMIELDIRYAYIGSPSFNKSSANETGFSDYCIWRQSEPSTGNWVRNPSNGLFYLAKSKSEPGNKWAHINYMNKNAVGAVKEAVRFWKGKKANGLKIAYADQLFPGEAFEGTDMDIKFIKDIRNDLYTKVDTGGKTALLVDVRNTSRVSNFIFNSTADLVVSYMLTNLSKDNGAVNAAKFKEYYGSMPEWPKEKTKVGPWSACAITSSARTLAKRVGEALTDAFLMISYMAPNCTQIINAGDELGQPDYKMDWQQVDIQLKSNHSHLQTFKSLIQRRNSNKDSFWMGRTFFPYASKDVFSIVRYYPENTGFLAIANLGEQHSFKLDSAAYLPDIGQVVLVNSATSGAVPPIGPIKLKEDITLSKDQAVLIEFIPVEKA